jgi:hypothetical protein
MWWGHLVCCHSLSFTLLAETTPGVYQASGYGDLAADKSIWYVNYLGSPSLVLLICILQQVLVLCGTQKP